MIFFILYTIGLILWFVCVIFQHNIINQQKELIEKQAEHIRMQNLRQRISNILIKEYRELSDMQKKFIEEFITKESSSVAYSQTYQSEGKNEK